MDVRELTSLNLNHFHPWMYTLIPAIHTQPVCSGYLVFDHPVSTPLPSNHSSPTSLEGSSSFLMPFFQWGRALGREWAYYDLGLTNHTPNTQTTVTGHECTYDSSCHDISGPYTRAALCFGWLGGSKCRTVRGHHMQPENEANTENRTAKECRENTAHRHHAHAWIKSCVRPLQSALFGYVDRHIPF